MNDFNDEVITEQEYEARIKTLELRKRNKNNRPPARPKVTPETDFPEGWEDQVLSQYKKGCFDSDIRIWFRENTKWKMGKTVWDRLISEDEHFRDIIEYGFDLSYQWWLNFAKSNMKLRSFNNAAWSKVMVNVFRWRDQITDITVDTARTSKYTNMSPDEIMTRINEKLNKGK